MRAKAALMVGVVAVSGLVSAFVMPGGAVGATRHEQAATVSVPRIELDGKVMGSASQLAAATAYVQAWPNDTYLAAMASGATVPMWSLGNSGVSSSGHYAVSVAASTIPSMYKNADGGVNLTATVVTGSSFLPVETSATPVTSTVTAAALAADADTGASMNVPATVTTNFVLGTGTDSVTADAGTLGAGTLSKAVATGSTAVQRIPSATFRRQLVQTLSVSHAEARTIMRAGTHVRSAATVKPEAGGVCPAPIATNSWKYGQSERFGQVHNWSGAPAEWSQSSGTSESMGVALKQPTSTKWVQDGSVSVNRDSKDTTSVSVSGIVNKAAYNKVNYREYTTSCYAQWRPVSFYSFFSKFTTADTETWDHSSQPYYPGSTFTQDTETAYTESGGVTLAGIISLDAQAGYTHSVNETDVIKQKSIVWGTNQAGLNQSRGIRVVKN